MVITKFELGKSYLYSDIDNFVDTSDDFVMKEYGEDFTGRGFLVVENDNDDFYSFMSDGWTSNGTTYKCISVG